LDSFNDDQFMALYWADKNQKWNEDEDENPVKAPYYITNMKNEDDDQLVLRLPGVQGFQKFVAPVLEKKMDKFWMQLIDPIISSEEPMKDAMMMLYWFDQAVAGTVKKNSFNFVNLCLSWNPCRKESGPPHGGSHAQPYRLSRERSQFPDPAR
jgi:hypothetical protein